MDLSAYPTSAGMRRYQLICYSDRLLIQSVCESELVEINSIAEVCTILEKQGKNLK